MVADTEAGIQNKEWIGIGLSYRTNNASWINAWEKPIRYKKCNENSVAK